ncbi:MAG: TSUP family transporter [Gaiellales bacterium]
MLGAIVRVEWLSGQQAFYIAAAGVLAALGLTLVARQPARGARPLALNRVPPIAFAVGVVGGIYGIGGGSFLAPILLIGGYPVYAVAPAALLSTLVASIVGVVTFVILGLTTSSSADITPDWGIGISAGIGGIIGAYLGATLQSRIPEPMLRRLLGLVALVIAVRYLYLGTAG